MPDVVSGSDREARIARRRLHENLFERSAVENLSVRHAIEGDAAGQTHGFQSSAFGQLFQHAQIDLFEPRLQGSSEISVPLFERLLGFPGWTQPAREFFGK